MRTWSCLVAILAFVLPAVAAISVEIDILPGEARNIVDPESPSTVRAALLGSETLDAQSIEPLSLRLAGAAIVKDDAGATHVLADVNGDGRLDLVVQFAARALQLHDADTVAVLEGSTVDGAPLRGQDAILTVRAALRSLGKAQSSEEKLPPLAVEISLLPRDAVAILGSADLDVREVVPDSIRVNGTPLTRGQSGEVVSYDDVNGDGLGDLVVFPRTSALSEKDVALYAATPTGRILRTGSETPSAEPEEGTRNQNPFLITIPDVGVAAPYPATIEIAGVSGVISKLRVTLNGIFHTCLNDLDVLLVGPGGQSIVLMSDVGGCGLATSGSVLTFDDFAAATLAPAVPAAQQASYRPINDTSGDPFPAPAPAPSGATALSAFNGTDPNGTWKLYVVDDAGGDSGGIADGWVLDIVTTTQVCNPTPLAVPDAGAASIYPSPITLAGLPANIAKLSVRLDGLTHASPDDLDVMLVDPLGHGILLMSDAGGATSIANLQLSFDDDVNSPLPDASAIAVSRSFSPTDYETGDVLPAPAPAGGLSTLGALRGHNPNGTWTLYVADDAAGSAGALARGWCLNVTTIAPTEMCAAAAITIPQGAPVNTAGPADPYPTGFEVQGTSGLVQSAQVRLFGLSHTYPGDLDVVLAAPSGKGLVLMSDAGGSLDVTNLDMTFDTTAVTPVPDLGLGSGPYRPTDYEGPDTLPAPAPAPPYATSISGEAPNGSWDLFVADDTGADVGTIAGGWCLDLTLFSPTFSFCTSGGNSLTIPAGAPGASSGPASPYPWELPIALDGTVIRQIQVRIQNLTHTYPDDLDLLMVGPTGQALLLMSDSGGSTDIVNRNLTFDDYAPDLPPDEGVLTDGTYRCGDQPGGGIDPFSAPAPNGYATGLGVYSGTDPKGIWNLYVMDDTDFDVGSIGQWCIDVFPLYPAAEATHLRWQSNKATLEWDAAANATSYLVVRGNPADLTSLLNGNVDSCFSTSTTQYMSGGFLGSSPAPGTFFWYLVIGRSANTPGPAGFARLGGQDTPRSADPQGICTP